MTKELGGSQNNPSRSTTRNGRNVCWSALDVRVITQKGNTEMCPLWHQSCNFSEQTKLASQRLYRVVMGKWSIKMLCDPAVVFMEPSSWTSLFNTELKAHRLPFVKSRRSLNQQCYPEESKKYNRFMKQFLELHFPIITVKPKAWQKDAWIMC